jgi:hypothetical protein
MFKLPGNWKTFSLLSFHLRTIAGKVCTDKNHKKANMKRTTQYNTQT